jgi:hypothetical protein
MGHSTLTAQNRPRDTLVQRYLLLIQLVLWLLTLGPVLGLIAL